MQQLGLQQLEPQQEGRQQLEMQQLGLQQLEPQQLEPLQEGRQQLEMQQEGRQQVSWQKPTPQPWSKHVEPQQELTMVSESGGSVVFQKSEVLQCETSLPSVAFIPCSGLL
ncbi:Basal cell adhesion molecule [Manis javanica]|nr:Basal cell adhesion molecule [Manis javanica]